MTYRAINFEEKLGLFDDRWQPRVIAEMNDFLVLDGVLRIDFRDGEVTLHKGEMFVVPAGWSTSRTPRARCACSSSSRAAR